MLHIKIIIILQSLLCHFSYITDIFFLECDVISQLHIKKINILLLACYIKKGMFEELIMKHVLV